MKLYFEDNDYKLYEGKMQEVLPTIEENSIDSIVTDPPYEIDFMNNKWDRSGVSFQKETWEHCFRVLKEGGYLLAFGGSKTYHRIACAIEDAGFEIRDCIMYLYGSGFPKSMNVGRAYDRKMGNIREKIGETRIDKTSLGDSSGWDTSQNMKNLKSIGKVDITKGNSQWEGYGSTLKPAYEPIIVARKPFKGSLVDNVLKNGVGAINIDECRIATKDFKDKKMTMPDFNDSGRNNAKITGLNKVGYNVVGTDKRLAYEYNMLGRFPANVITDGSEEVAKGMSDASRYFYCAKASNKDRDEGCEYLETKSPAEVNNRKEGSAGLERAYGGRTNPFLSVSSPRKNTHACVKPTELMQYLVRLVNPKGATILDPFMGSGSTGKAVMFENRERNANYRFIGIEMTDEYLPICKGRIDYAKNKYEYDTKKALEEEKEKNDKIGQITLF